MSRLDRHVDAVQNKLALGEFLRAAALGAIIFAGLVWLAILLDKIVQIRLPRPSLWFWIGAGVALAASIGIAIWKRPTRHQAAIAIDQTLGLKERFSTALYARPTGNDPFAAAAVMDAERTAENVSIHKRFPVSFPRGFLVALVIAIAAGITSRMTPLDLFGRAVEQKKQVAEAAKIEQSKQTVREAIAKVESVAKTLPNDDSVRIAKRDLEKLLNAPSKDPEAVKRSALKAMQEMNEGIKQKIKDSQKFANAESDAKMLKSMSIAPEEKGPVADAHRDIAKGDFAKAIDDLQKAVDNFDKMDEKEQKKAAEQMKQMAQQIAQMAQNPNMQQQMQQQLQQMGANQQQAQQIAQMMQQAAAGNQQAQQQLQQMQQQMMQQMAANPQLQAQAQQMMNQMQAQANGQAQAQQMAQAAQQMAQAMQQGAQQGQQQGQQPGQQNQQGQQGGNPQQQQQQMAQAVQQMQQQLQQMQAAQQDAQQIAAAQQQAQQGADQAMNAMNGQPGGQNGQDQQGQGQGQNGEWKEGDPAGKQGGGQGGPGQGNGGRAKSAQAPFAVKQEISPSQDNKDGKILASTFVKAGTIKGESKVELSNVAASAENDATDEVDQERVSRGAQKAVREYFGSMEKDAAK